MLKQLNIESILAWKPCYHPSRRLPENWTGTIIDLLDNKDIPHGDRIWLATKYLPLRDIQEFTIWCARQAFKSKGVEVNKASRNVVDVAELYLYGNASLDELIEAKNDAYAATYAAYAAINAAVYAAIREKQIEYLKQVCLRGK